MITKDMKSYILMADIIDSSHYEQDELMRAFKVNVQNINKTFNGRLLSPLTITLGDEFQGICKQLKDSIEIIFKFKQLTLNSKPRMFLRFSCVYGDIETDINTNNAYGMLGSGLTTARQLLNDKKRDQFNVQINTQNTVLDDLMQNTFEIMHLIETNSWKNKNTNIINDFIYSRDKNNSYLSDTEVGELNNKNQSQISKYRKNWDIDAYRSAIEILQSLIENIEEPKSQNEIPYIALGANTKLQTGE